MRGSSGGGSFLITGCELVLADRVVPHGAVLASEGKIVFAGDESKLPLPPAGERIPENAPWLSWELSFVARGCFPAYRATFELPVYRRPPGRTPA